MQGGKRFASGVRPPEDEKVVCPETYNFARQFINQVTKQFTGAGVLVHCAAGVSRSGSAVIAYIMATKKLSFASARELEIQPVITS